MSATSEGSSTALGQVRRRAVHQAGSETAARSKRMTQQPGRPLSLRMFGRWLARETEEAVDGGRGVGGSRTSEEVGERMTTDPAEQRRPASRRASGGKHGRR